MVAAGLVAALGTSEARGAALQNQLQIAATPAVELVVSTPGWQHVPRAALIAAGLEPGVDPADLQLFTDGVEQAMSVTGNGDDVFDAGEAIEFYGQARDTLWTGSRTYWLVAGGAGKRIPLVVYPGGAGAPDSFPDAAISEQRTTYFAALKNGEASNFFGAEVGASGVTDAVQVVHLDTSQPAALQVVLQGVTAGDHQVAISLDGAPVGNCAFAGQTLQTCTVSPVTAVEGTNDVSLVGQGGASDISLVARLEIDYQHLYVAGDDALALSAPPAAQIAIAGFSSADVRVMDVTDPSNPVELVTGVSAVGSTYTVTVNTPPDTAWPSLYAFTGAAALAPASVAPSRPSSWTDPRAGELVILSHALFLDALAPLVAARRQQGWSVQLIDLQDVYDEFGGGDKTAFAVRDFLQAVRASWTVPPRFVLLVGDASFDPRNYLGMGDLDFAPTKLVDTQQMETSSDGWFVDWNGDGIEDIGIGRISVRTAAEASTVVQKLVGYGGAAGLSRGGLFVADVDDDGLPFQEDSQASAAAVAPLLPTTDFFAGQPGSTEAALVGALDGGPFLVNYMGHGSVSVWDGLFSGSDAAALSNGPLSIYVSMNCLNGFFQDLYTESLAETLTKAPGGGAVAVWASSTLTSFDQQGTLDAEFVKRLTRTSLGEAAIAAKRAITDPDAQRTWMLFGDPTLFGTPTPPATDGGAGDGGPTDAGRRDGGSPTGTGGAGGREGAAIDAAVDAVVDGRTDARAGGGRSGQAGGPAEGPEAGAGGMTLGSGGGCGCGISGAGSPAGGGLLGLALVAAVAIRRRSRHDAAQASTMDR
jgi:MYXO-CTERM domain-containing protein